MKLTLTILALLAFGGSAAYYLNATDHAGHSATSDSAGGDEHGDHDDHAEAVPKGPHGGRLLTEDKFALELAIYEQGVPPEFRAWFSLADQPIDSDSVKLSVVLQRPGGVVDTITFSPEGSYARGNSEIYEPHSFSYRILAEHAGRTYQWAFDAPEMQTTISAAAAERAGVVLEFAGPATMRETLAVYGQIKLNANRVARAAPRFGGIVREARKALGDSVEAGEVVAIVETNQSLVAIEVKAPIAGIIVDRNINVGESVTDGATLYTIADLADVWVDLNVPKRDQARVKLGQVTSILADDGGPAAVGQISWISPISSAEAQTLVARVVLDNTDRRWRPGLFVKAEVTVSESVAAVAVRESALQTLFDFNVVFTQHGDVYQARPLELGRHAQGFVEVLQGLHAGESYVTENSFLIKADIGKSSASHDH